LFADIVVRDSESLLPAKSGIVSLDLREVRVMESNRPAQRFWARAIATALNQPVSPVQAEAAGRRWYVFSFDSISAH
jgi:hypothetical protein